MIGLFRQWPLGHLCITSVHAPLAHSRELICWLQCFPRLANHAHHHYTLCLCACLRGNAQPGPKERQKG